MKPIICLIMMLPFFMFSQEQISGEVLEANTENKTIPVAGANVFWLNTSVGAVTDIDGKFTIPYEASYKQLVISYVGYQTDTLTINQQKYIKHYLKLSSVLDEIVVTSRKQSTVKSYMKAANVITVSSDELLKAACCNLSESFETNPAIDVNLSLSLIHI